ncbi:MAG: DUF2911 domain-containing protein [Bacteroidetes bacterium]|nr:MAG: DUF2911 domain-containing protein [Bacteroidota bacterium]REK06473.1 MAG: DUF2911 domain-containing protein [Bacteroidota bacterium]REK33239.1 MAG: DUF2911 domain-containing protein [Bacteroidota bacterium]REK47076.1 MAG: DUF2911 domain-containing protein [Bacteroidota bacterium]
MKKTYNLFAALVLLCFYSINSNAQLQLPASSPKAVVTQTAGLTDITIDYSSPGVKGRVVYGDLVPYDQVWRTGANAATKITFSKDVSINGTKVSKGSYSLFTIPGKVEWTIILNKDANVSVSAYKQDDDLMRFNVKPEVIPHRERFAFIISDFDDNKARIDMEWEKLRVSFNVNLFTDEQAADNIKNTLGGTWRMYNAAARYQMDTKKDYESALKHVNQSIALSDEWFNNWVKAQVLSAMKKNKEAYEHATKAKTLGDKAGEGFFFKDQVEKALKEWPKQ